MDEWMDGWMGGLGGWMDGWVIRCIWSGDWVDVDGCMAGWIFERFDWIRPVIWSDDQIWHVWLDGWILKYFD